MECVVVIASLAGLLGSAYLLTFAVVRIRRSPDDKFAQFTYGYLAVFALGMGIASCLGIVLVLGTYVGSSWLAAAAVVAVNLLMQPLAILLCWTGIRKIALGVCGQVGYAWKRVPEEKLAELTPSERRRLALYCVFQGVLVLPLGMLMSVVCASPLVVEIRS